MRKYLTSSGDMWDGVAYRELGSEKLTEKLLDANRDKLEYFIFPAGIELNIPDVTDRQSVIKPPWRK